MRQHHNSNRQIESLSSPTTTSAIYSRGGRSGSGQVHVAVRVKPVDSGDQSIFSGDLENGKSVVACSIPQKSRLSAQSQYKGDADLERVQDIFPGDPSVFIYDAVYQKSSQERFYKKTAHSAVEKVLAGQNAAVLIYGPSRCGKTYALIGAEKQEKGLLFRCYEELHAFAKENKHYPSSSISSRHPAPPPPVLSLSIFSVFQNEIFDLLTESPIHSTFHEIIEEPNQQIRIESLSSHPLVSKTEVKQHYVAALRRIQKLSASIKEKKLYEKSHIVIQLSLIASPSTTKLQLIRLADSDLVADSSDDLEVLGEYIKQINNRSEFNNRVYKKATLTSAIKDTLSPVTSAHLICCVGASSPLYQASFASLQYASSFVKDGQQTRQHRQTATKQQPQQQQLHQSAVGQSISSQSNSSLIRVLGGSASVSSLQSKRSATGLNSSHPQLNLNSPRDNSVVNQAESPSQLQFILKELELIYDDIRKQSRVFGRLPERERNEWVDQKLHILSELAKQIEIQPYTREIPQCEAIMQKCQQQLQLINPIADNRHQHLSGSPPSHQKQSYYFTLQQPAGKVDVQQRSTLSHHSNHSAVLLSPSVENRVNDQQFLREKEERLNNEFKRLITRYNHSRELVDGLANHINNSSSSASVQSPPLQAINSSLRSGNHNNDDQHESKKQKSTHKSQRVSDLIASPPPSKHRQNESGSGLPPRVPPAMRSPSAADDVEILLSADSNKEKNVGRSLQRLQETIELKENMEKSKVQRLRSINSELKASLKEYVSRCEEQTQLLRRKDEEINRIEFEIRQANEDMLLNTDQVRELKIKEQGWLHIENELREANLTLKQKLATKKNKHSQAKLDATKKYEEVVQQLKSYQIENDRLSKATSVHEDARREESQRMAGDKERLSSLQQEVQEKDEQLRIAMSTLEEQGSSFSGLNAKLAQATSEKQELSGQNVTLSRKNEDLSEQVRILEQKLLRVKEKFEEEKQRVAAAQTAENAKKKEKIQSLKAQITDIEDRLAESEAKNVNLLAENARIEGNLKDTTKLASDLRSARDAHVATIAKLTEENKAGKIDGERLQNLLASVEAKCVKIEAAQLSDASIIQQLRSDNELLEQELNQKLHELQESNEYIENVKRQKEEELSEFEVKLEQVIDQMQVQKEENQEAKRKEAENKKTIIGLEEQVEKYKEKYLKVKHSNKNLQGSFKEMESIRARDNAAEKSVEILNQAKEKERVQKSDTQKTKLRILDEIQSMIKVHKQSASQSSFRN